MNYEYYDADRRGVASSILSNANPPGTASMHATANRAGDGQNVFGN